MSQDIKGDHFKPMKGIHQDMENFIVEIFAQSCSKNGEGAFTGDIVQDAGLRPAVGANSGRPMGSLRYPDAQEERPLKQIKS